MAEGIICADGDHRVLRRGKGEELRRSGCAAAVVATFSSVSGPIRASAPPALRTLHHCIFARGLRVPLQQRGRFAILQMEHQRVVIHWGAGICVRAGRRQHVDCNRRPNQYGHPHADDERATPSAAASASNSR